MAGERMYEPAYYKNLSLTEIREKVVTEGFDPIRIVDPPGRVATPKPSSSLFLRAKWM